MRGGGWNERWYLLKVESELARGKYAEALATLEAGVRRYPSSVALRWLGIGVSRYNGRDDDAAAELETIERLILARLSGSRRRKAGSSSAASSSSEGPTPARCSTSSTTSRPSKHPTWSTPTSPPRSSPSPSKTPPSPPRPSPRPPRPPSTTRKYQYLLALAFADDDRAKASEALGRALKINPSHADSLLLQADHLIDSERYAEAAEVLKRVFAVNPSDPRAWAYTAVIAHLRNDPKAEAEARKSALEHWETNPEVNHILGRKLSQKYRFAEGSEAQKRALAIDRRLSPRQDPALPGPPPARQ